MSLAKLEYELLTNPGTRSRFAAEPSTVCREQLVSLPADAPVPISVAASALELRILEISVRLTQAGVEIDAVSPDDDVALTRLSESIEGLAVTAGASDALSWLLASDAPPSGADAAVAARLTNDSPSGVTASAPTSTGLTVLGPTGTEVTGLSLDAVATLIRRLRQ